MKRAASLRPTLARTWFMGVSIRGKPRLYTTFLASSASTTTAAAVTAMASTIASAAWATTAPTPTTIAIAIASGATACITRTIRACDDWFGGTGQSIHTVKVRLISGVKIGATFDHGRRRALRCVLRRYRRGRHRPCSLVHFRRRSSSAHFCALLFQNRLARELDPVAFNAQDFYQDLVAFF